MAFPIGTWKSFARNFKAEKISIESLFSEDFCLGQPRREASLESQSFRRGEILNLDPKTGHGGTIPHVTWLSSFCPCPDIAPISQFMDQLLTKEDVDRVLGRFKKWTNPGNACGTLSNVTGRQNSSKEVLQKANKGRDCRRSYRSW